MPYPGKRGGGILSRQNRVIQVGIRPGLQRNHCFKQEVISKYACWLSKGLSTAQPGRCQRSRMGSISAEWWWPVIKSHPTLLLNCRLSGLVSKAFTGLCCQQNTGMRLGRHPSFVNLPMETLLYLFVCPSLQAHSRISFATLLGRCCWKQGCNHSALPDTPFTPAKSTKALSRKISTLLLSAWIAVIELPQFL